MTATAAPTRTLTQRSASELAAAIRARELTSREVVEEHLALLQRVNPRINAVVCPRFEQARADADAADRRVAEAGPGEELPPFLGVPCTIKESFAVEGMPNCAGLVSRKDHRAPETAPAAARLMEAGAIPMGLTNVPELTMWPETINRVYGRTNNPYDASRTAGGSSGGEGAAVGSGASPIGLGSDIGGSIRIPAFCNGVFGHKPSPGLVPNTGQFPDSDLGDSAYLLATGPLVRRAADLMPFLKAIAGPDGRDPGCVELPLGDPAEVDIDGLEVLVTDDASIVPLRGEVRAARDRAAEALAGAGARVRQVSLRSLRRVLDLYLTALGRGSGASFRLLIEEATGSPVNLRTLLRRGGPHTPFTRLLLASEWTSNMVPERRVRKAIAAGQALRRELAEIVGDGVLLYPPLPRVAPRHNRTLARPWIFSSMFVFNLAGMPVTQVPLGLGRKGLPVGVQVGAAPGRDDLTIAAALELERACGGWVPPPR
jgi:fatty acid amide hydrolase 2